METEKELNKVLADIYSDLEKLQSAREQVEIVTENSKDLTLTTSTLLKELRELSNQFGKENSSNISQLTRGLNDFESKINKISEKGNQSIDEYIASFKKQIIGVIEQFSQQLANNEKNLNAISNLNNEKIGNKIEEFVKTTKDLKINAEKGIEEIKAVAISKIEIQEKIISKTIANIEDTNLKNFDFFKNQIVGVIDELSQQIAHNEKNLMAISNLINEKIGEKIEEFEKTTKDLKLNTEKEIEEIKTVAINNIEIQEQIISKTIANIEETNLKNKELLNIITEYGIPKSLENINTKLEIQINQNELIKKLLIVILFLIGLGGLTALGLIVKLF